MDSDTKTQNEGVWELKTWEKWILFYYVNGNGRLKTGKVYGRR
jgi:hypothetical protein